MQTGTEQIRAQQEIMKAFGFYNGKLDGTWGPMSVEAKKKWELSGKFAPGLPNFGLPLSNRGPYPRGVYMDKATGLLTCAEIEQAKAKAQAAPVKSPIKVEVPAAVTPVVEAPKA